MNATEFKQATATPDSIPVMVTTNPEQAGCASFNAPCPHVCIKVPHGQSTVTCITPDGKRVTFAFLPYETNGVPRCVDVMNHHRNPAAQIRRGEFSAPLAIQSIRLFRPYAPKGHRDKDPLSPEQITLATLILK